MDEREVLRRFPKWRETVEAHMALRNKLTFDAPDGRDDERFIFSGGEARRADRFAEFLRIRDKLDRASREDIWEDGPDRV